MDEKDDIEKHSLEDMEKHILELETQKLSEYKDASLDATNIILATGTGVAATLSATGFGVGVGISVLALTIVVTQLNSAIQNNIDLNEFMPSLFISLLNLQVSMIENQNRVLIICDNETYKSKINNQEIIKLLHDLLTKYLKDVMSLSLSLLCAMPNETFQEFVDNCQHVFFREIFDEVVYRKQRIGNDAFFTFIRTFSASDLNFAFQKQLLIIQTDVITINLLLHEVEFSIKSDDALFQEYTENIRSNTKQELLSVTNSENSSKTNSVGSEKSLNSSEKSFDGSQDTNPEITRSGFHIVFTHDEASRSISQITEDIVIHLTKVKDLSVNIAASAKLYIENSIEGAGSVLSSTGNQGLDLIHGSVKNMGTAASLVLETIPSTFISSSSKKGGLRKNFQTKKRNKIRKTKNKKENRNNKKHVRFTKRKRFIKRN